MLIIAEAGSNHEGSVSKALELVDAAHEAGADIVKFQAINRSEIWYDSKERPEWIEQGVEFFVQIAEYCDRRKIEFLCTPFDDRQVGWLNPLVKRWKLASSHLWNAPLRAAIAQTRKPLIGSLGYQSPHDHAAFRGVIPLVCRPEYPALPASYALKVWASALRGREWGISDHTIGYATSLTAIGLGASIVEKHFKVRATMSPDSGAHALDPAALGEFVVFCREAERARDGIWIEPPMPVGRRIWK